MAWEQVTYLPRPFLIHKRYKNNVTLYNSRCLYIFTDSFFVIFCSSSLDSPHLLSKDVTGSTGMPSTATPSTAKADVSTPSSINASQNENAAPQQVYPSEKHQLNPETYWDSDFEAERDPPDWRPKMNQDELAHLKPKEKKRQDVINGK